MKKYKIQKNIFETNLLIDITSAYVYTFSRLNDPFKNLINKTFKVVFRKKLDCLYSIIFCFNAHAQHKISPLVFGKTGDKK